MELRQLEYFESVARTKSFTKAANELCVAQPSITVAIRKLEEELGLPLFKRVQKNITLTFEGEVFLQSTKKILSQIKDSIKEINDLRPDANLILRMGIPPSLGSWLLPLLFTDFSTKHPNIQFDIQELGITGIIENVRNEKVELGYIVFEQPTPDFELFPISEVELLLLLPGEHPLREFDRVPFELIKNEKILMHPESTFIYRKVLEECQKRKFQPNILCKSPQNSTIFNLVTSGIGISFILDDTVAILKNNVDVIIRPFEDPIKYSSGLIWKKEKYLSKASRQFLDFLKPRQ